MCLVAAFFPGRRRLTNGMLDDLRAAGFYAGLAKGRGWRKPRPGFDAFANETAAIRELVWARFRAFDRGPDPKIWDSVRVVVWVVGHHKSDPDSWLLLGKAALDGVCDAKVARRDRDGVLLSGRVSRHIGERCPDLRWTGRFDDTGEIGFWVVVVSDLGCGCPKVQELRGGG